VFRNWRSIPRLLVLAIWIVCADPFGAEASRMQDVLTRASRAEGDVQRRFQSFIELVEGLDPLVARATISPCAAFGFLAGRLYEAVEHEPRRFLKLSVFLLGDSEHVNRYRNRMRSVVEGLPGASLILKMEDIPDYSGSREQVLEKLLGRKAFGLPRWIPGRRGPLVRLGQGLQQGYIQGDADTSGRHDHYLFNAAFGFALEKSRPSKILRWSTLGAAQDAAGRTAGPVADIVVEKFLNQNSDASSTDMLVNARGRALGRELAIEPPRHGLELSNRIFADICDERVANPGLRGPLTPSLIEKAYDEAAAQRHVR